MKKKYKIMLGAGAALIVLLGGFTFFAWRYVNAEYDGKKPAWIYLPRGTSRAALADSLESALGADLSSKVYRIYCAKAADNAAIHGAYEIQPGTSAKDIARRLIGRTQTPVDFTFSNLRTLEQLADSVGAKLDMSAAEFLAACDSVLPRSGFACAEQYPAAFMPDKYEVYWTTTGENLVKKMLGVRNAFWNDQRRAQARELGLTPVQVATIASIAEEETNNAEERAIVARLYFNRVARGMMLQADPTVKFAVGDFGLRRILNEHLAVESPYNTYKYAGVPPGPIRIAERATIDNALNSRKHNYLYMCARPDGSGLHDFTSSFSEHRENARRFQRWLNSRGIRK